MSHYFRIDDVSLNTDRLKLSGMVKELRSVHPNCRIMAAVSPCVYDLQNERTFPELLNRESDFRLFYRVEKLGLPVDLSALVDDVAAHGMIHVDHRLLHKSAQEVSILMSCSLVGCKVFVPPFHKFNRDTEEICSEHGIQLVKIHDRMTHLKFHPVTPDRNYYYFHTFDFKNLDAFQRQIGGCV